MFQSVCGSVGGFYCLNFQNFRYTSPLKPGSLSLTKHSFRIREDLLDYKSAAIRRWHISWSQRRFVPKEIEKCDRLCERYWVVLRMADSFCYIFLWLIWPCLLERKKFSCRNSDGVYSGSGQRYWNSRGSLVCIACPVVRVYPSTG